MFLNARTILGLPGKIGNANTSLNRKVGAFSLRVSGQRIVSSIKNKTTQLDGLTDRGGTNAS